MHCRVAGLVAALLLAAIQTGLSQQSQSTAAVGAVATTDGTGVPGAMLLVRHGERLVASTVADQAGRFRVLGLSAGTYEIEAQSLGYRTVRQEFRLEGSTVNELRITLPAAPLALEEVVVSATRSSMPIAAIPAAITVVDRKAVQDGASTSNGIGELLGKAVPGLAAGTQSMSNFGQSLRGRSVVVLIDGVPQSTLRNVSRDFATIDPAMVERVEVVRGATAIYGDGATGGVINIITRRPGVGELSMRSELSAAASLAAPGDGLSGRLVQSMSGNNGALDYSLGATLGRSGGFYDAEGDLIPADPHGQGGLADTRSSDLFSKLGWSHSTQRIQLGINYFHTDQDTRFAADPSVNALPKGEAKARALEGLQEDQPQGTRNLNTSLDYNHGELLGGQLHVQGYYRDYVTRFRGFDRRVIRNGQVVSGHVGQSYIDSYKVGGRLEFDSPLRFAKGSLLVGADYTHENTTQRMAVMDPALYDASGGLLFERIDDRVWVPALRPHNLGLFAQVGFTPSERISLRAGVRHERIRMHVDDFMTIDEAAVTGGDVHYDPTLFNAGATYNVTGTFNVFGSFSQGFSLADIGRILRGAKAGFAVGNSTLEAPQVDHYEIGLRAGHSGFSASFSTFFSTSDLGTRLLQDSLGILRVLRAPERIYGAEASLEVRSGAFTVGGSASWTEGEYRNEATAEWLPFDSWRIQPAKMTAHVAHVSGAGWENRLQAIHSAARARLWEQLGSPEPAQIGYGQWPVTSYTVLDVLSRRPLGPGTIEFSIQNLLNSRYFDVVSQLDQADGNSYRTMARGALLNIGYSISY